MVSMFERSPIPSRSIRPHKGLAFKFFIPYKLSNDRFVRANYFRSF